ncbi:MAG TPA: SDR family oxidoreductase [Solirubrobacteraceae bacterium]|nr:SDR family oxidoreductase [Solirubrobacteraceae bacterium]
MAAIITGSDSGIGKATAVALARRGHDVGITYSRDADGAQAAAEEVRSHDRRAEVRQLDLTQSGDVQPAIDELADALAGLDVLVNNAGSGADTPFLELELAQWRDVLEVDLTGALLTAQAAARRMVASGTRGRIVNVTSVHEHVPLRGATPYVVAKHGLGGLTKMMALELAEHGITVNSVAPGEIATPMTGQEDEDPRQARRPGVPAGRPGDAREVADLIAYLTSAEASYTTGASYVVDGGLLLMAAQANLIAMR